MLLHARARIDEARAQMDDVLERHRRCTEETQDRLFHTRTSVSPSPPQLSPSPAPPAELPEMAITERQLRAMTELQQGGEWLGKAEEAEVAALAIEEGREAVSVSMLTDIPDKVFASQCTLMLCALGRVCRLVWPQLPLHACLSPAPALLL